jgi:hypothetical protein
MTLSVYFPGDRCFRRVSNAMIVALSEARPHAMREIILKLSNKNEDCPTLPAASVKKYR